MRFARFATVVVAWGAVALAPATATAQPTAEARTLAESLFREGRRLMEDGKTAEGCRKLEESWRLDPAAGTLLNLAVCHEKEGKTATAWGEFTQAAQQARRDNRPDREELAQERVKALEPTLARATIEVPGPARVEGLEVLKDGIALGAGAWGLALPTDPGAIVVEARAPGRKPWKQVASVATKASLIVTVPTLEPEEPRPAPPVLRASSFDDAGQPDPGRRTAALVTGGAGILALGVGTVFGIQTFSKKSESDEHCPLVNGARSCTQRGVDAADAAKTSATVANVTLGVGIAAVAVGTWLWLTSGPPKTSTPRAARAGWRSVDVGYGVDGRAPGATVVGRW